MSTTGQKKMTENDRCTNVWRLPGNVKPGMPFKCLSSSICSGTMLYKKLRCTELIENDISKGINVVASSQVEKYVGEIKGGLRPTMKITIMGVISPIPKSFSVTLLCDPMDASKDVGLLLAVNFIEKSIVRNSRIAGKWGKEEKTIPYFPFTAGDSFKMELLCEHQQIRVLLDGRQFCSFSHRVQPPQKVTALQISGDLKLTKVA